MSLVRVRRPLPKPLLLKDHLLDDMSSCSSNGFRSFPRRSPQCCTAVRFLDPTSKSSPLSALRSAVVAAAKHLPFAAAKSTGNRKSSRKSSSLARSLSRKLLERGGFWKRKREWKPLEQLMKEDSDSKSSDSGWGSDFTVSFDDNSSSPSEVNLDSPKGKMVNCAANEGAGNGVVSAGQTEQKQWSSDQEKEQFSPVSVLDCPFDEVSPVFKHRLARMEGKKLELVKKIQRFECLAKLEPVNLATQFALQSDNSDNESPDSTLPRSSYSLDDKSISDIEEDVDGEKEAEHTALELLLQVRANCSPSYQPDLNLKEDKLLLDFFRENITNKLVSSDKQRSLSSFDKGLLDEAEEWINGREPRNVFAKWEVQKNRQAYVDDMEKRGEWGTLDQEREVVALELENEVFVDLMNELLLEISN